MTTSTCAWPDLSAVELRPTIETLHLWSQIVGKIRLMMTPWINHGWHVPLIAIFLLELLARRLRLPPAAAFILGGIVLALVPGVPTFEIDPDLVLLIFMPPLLMNGAYFTVWREFKANISGILLLALGAVAFTTLVVGVAATLLAPELPWAVCFALGAIVSPPDAVAAGAVLERLSLPGRMSSLLQGESLLNDASGLVLFRFAVAAALTGSFSMTAALGSFCLLSVGGVAFGWAVGRVGLLVIRRLRDSELMAQDLQPTIISQPAINTQLSRGGLSYGAKASAPGLALDAVRTLSPLSVWLSWIAFRVSLVRSP